MLVIKPDYSKHPKCFFCGVEEAEKSTAASTELYCVHKKHLTSYDYTTTKIEIPRCKKCNEKHSYASLPIIFFTIGIFAFVLSWKILPQWPKNDFFGNIIICFVSLLLSVFGGYILGIIPSMIISSSLKTTAENLTDDYGPIKKLIAIGYLKEKPKPHTHPDEKYNPEVLQKTLQTIASEDFCIIEEKK